MVATIICCSSLREKFISYLSARLAQARSNCNCDCSRSCPTCLAAGQSLNFYGASLTLLSVADTLKPLRCTAINLVDFYIVRKGHYSIREIFNPSGMYGRWNWRGLLAYGTGFLVMIPFFSTPTYQGPAARADRRHGARPVRTRPLRYYAINAHSAAWRQLSFARHIRVHASPGTSPRRRAASRISPGPMHLCNIKGAVVQDCACALHSLWAPEGI